MLTVLTQLAQKDPGAFAPFDSVYRPSQCRFLETACAFFRNVSLRDDATSGTVVVSGDLICDEWLWIMASRGPAMRMIAVNQRDEAQAVSIFTISAIGIGSVKEVIRNFGPVLAVQLRDPRRPRGATQEAGRTTLRKLVFGRLRKARDSWQAPVTGWAA